MKLFTWIGNWRSIRRSSIDLLKRGVSSSNHHESANAMQHYTAAIETVGVPDDIKAMALYNRALLHASAKNLPKAIADLNAVVDMSAPLRQIKSAARQKLNRLSHQETPEPSR